jgi:hypothetical protein
MMQQKIYYDLKLLQNSTLHSIFQYNHSGAMLKLIKHPILWYFQTSLRSSSASSGLKELIFCKDRRF